MVQLRAAVQRLLRGDGSAYRELWSHAEDATMMGAYGGLAAGWSQIGAAIDRAAQKYAGWQPEYSEQLIAAQAVGDMGYVILRERVGNGAGSDAVRSRRVTVLYRREGDRWRIFHHHSDPLHDHEPPERTGTA
ncbi:nuclear transport factor 2 family protein [Leifsonia shinshuensis]|uniref:YybH family protein n=1 Tax=Leifsonia shinshuensis TaxID=150026 RepID=UPI001F50623F|nr:nuclear transport factor 2 family protein [Leifsonia shinshuensis]MCI0157823.1 nuclear transport factor 2 family protein [Leifsonia shinshuensis]